MIIFSAEFPRKSSVRLKMIKMIIVFLRSELAALSVPMHRGRA